MDKLLILVPFSLFGLSVLYTHPKTQAYTKAILAIPVFFMGAVFLIWGAYNLLLDLGNFSIPVRITVIHEQGNK